MSKAARARAWRPGIGRVWLHLRDPLMFDAYARNRETGSFILVDEATNRTVAAGMINGPHTQNTNIVWQTTKVGREQRANLGATLWMTGLSGSGKSTLAIELERRLVAAGRPAYILDGDNLRHGLNADLGFSDSDRHENLRRTARTGRWPCAGPFRRSRMVRMDAAGGRHPAPGRAGHARLSAAAWINPSSTTRPA